MRVLAPAAVYFGVVFAVAFGLGTLRVLLLEPAIGVSAAELLEMPLLLGVCFLAARWLVRRFGLRGQPRRALLAGLLALGATLVFELLVVLRVRGLDLDGYLADRAPGVHAAYFTTLALFGLLPWLLARPR